MADTNIRVRDADGRELQVDPALARDGLLKGAYVPAGQKIRVGRGSQTGTVDAADIQSAIDSGWEPISEEQATDARIQREESTVLGQARGTAEAFGSGLTFGFSDYVIAGHNAAQGDTEANDRYRARNKAAGSVADTARLAGEILPTLFTGGGAAGAKVGISAGRMGLAAAAKQGAGRGIRALGALPRGVEALGLAAERGVGRVLGEGLGARTVGAFARGSIEGAAGAVGEEIHESVIGGRDITAERLLAAGGMGALFGGGASAAFPLTGAALRRGAKVPREAVQGVLAKVSKGDPANMGKAAEWVETVTSGRNFDPIKKQAELFKSKDGRQLLYEATHEAREGAEKAAALIKKETEDLASGIDDVWKATEGARSGSMERLFSAEHDAIVPDLVRRNLDDLEMKLGEGFGMAEKYGPTEISTRHLDAMQAEINKARDEIAGGLSSGKAHTRLLQVKRRARELIKDVGARDSKGVTTQRLLKDIEGQINKRLGADEFGDAGRMWREINDADAAALAGSDQVFKRNRETGAREGRNLLGRVLNGEASDAEILTLTKRVGDSRHADQVGRVDDYFERQIQAMRVRAKHTDDAALLQKVDGLEKRLGDYRKTMSRQAVVADIIDANKASGRGGLMGALTLFGPSGATIAGGLLGGAPGVAIGAALNAAARPAQSIRTLAAIAHLADRAGIDVDRIVGGVTGAAKLGSAKAPSRISRAAGRAAGAAKRGAKRGRGVASRVAGRAAVSRNDQQRQRQRRASELADPDTLTRELAQQMYALTDAAPGIAGAAAEKVAVAAAFLEGKLPPEVHDPITGSKRIIDPATRDSFDRYYEAVTDPVATLERLEDGTMTIEHAEALREVWPALYEDVRGKVFEGLRQAADDGRTIPYSRRQSLGVLFDLPTTPEMAPEYIQAAAAMAGGETERANAQDEAQANDRATRRTRKTDLESTGNYDTTISRIERREA